MKLRAFLILLLPFFNSALMAETEPLLRLWYNEPARG